MRLRAVPLVTAHPAIPDYRGGGGGGGVAPLLLTGRLSGLGLDKKVIMSTISAISKM